MVERYINPFTDFGFKKLFGEEANKDLLIDFLNQLLAGEEVITELTFLKTERLGLAEADRKAIFDLYCQNEKGERFIVELQKAKQLYFKDRSLYYATFAIQEQAQAGEWDFKLKTVYMISIMDFSFDETENDRFLHDVRLIEKSTLRIFNDKLRFLYLEMPKFEKAEAELETHFDKWLYVLKNLARLDRIPINLQERIFEKLFSVAELANYNRDDQRAYQDSLKYYRDLKNALDTQFLEGIQEGRERGLEEGRQEGRQEEKVMIARQMKREEFSDVQISKLTGLGDEELAQL